METVRKALRGKVYKTERIMPENNFMKKLRIFVLGEAMIYDAK
ncbi:MAG: hypothetical protein V4665_03150 [Patescibacteria group bacterium]